MTSPHTGLSDEEMWEEWHCAGCGISSPNRVRSCDCATEVVTKDNKQEWKVNPPSAQSLQERLLDAGITDPHLVWLMRQEAKNEIESLNAALSAMREVERRVASAREEVRDEASKLDDAFWEISGPRIYLNIPTQVPDRWRARLAWGKWPQSREVVGWGPTEKDARNAALEAALRKGGE